MLITKKLVSAEKSKFCLSGFRITVKEYADEKIYSNIRTNGSKDENAQEENEIAVSWFT